MPHSHQVVLVTGASSGIGLATAEALLARGHTVYGAARRVDKMAGLEAAGGHAIALDGMMETSGAGPYADFAAKTKRMFEGAYEDPKTSSPPSVIADVIVEAVEAESPKTRYVAGAQARTFLTARALLPDRLFDALIRSQMK